MIVLSLLPLNSVIPEPGSGQKIDPGVPLGCLQDDAISTHLARGEASHLRHQPAARVNKAEITLDSTFENLIQS